MAAEEVKKQLITFNKKLEDLKMLQIRLEEAVETKTRYIGGAGAINIGLPKEYFRFLEKEARAFNKKHGVGYATPNKIAKAILTAVIRGELDRLNQLSSSEIKAFKISKKIGSLVVNQ